jgi:hypothetical protein
MKSKGWENNIIFPVIKNTDNKDMTPQEIFEKKTGRPATFTEYMGVYEADYVLMLEEQNVLMLEALKKVTARLKKHYNSKSEPEAIELMDIIDAENLINQVSGE